MAAGTTPPAGDAAIEVGRLVGTWRLTSWESIDPDGSITRPFGTDPMGYVVYTADGRMITTISRAHRAPIGGDLLSASPRGRAEAAASFVAYSGTFRLEGDEVVHDVEMSLFPDWVGTRQRRHVSLTDDGATLTLSSIPPTAGGPSVCRRLIWERVMGSDETDSEALRGPTRG